MDLSVALKFFDSKNIFEFNFIKTYAFESKFD